MWCNFRNENQNLKRKCYKFVGLRKPPQIASGTNYENYLLTQWKNIIDEQARRRFQQQRQKQQFAFSNDGDSLTEEMSRPDFTYKLPVQYSSFGSEDEIPFAVGPGHPKFYDKIPNTNKDPAKTEQMMSYKNVLNSENDPVHLTSDGILSYKVKAPMNVNPKIIPYDDALNADTDNSYEMTNSQDVLTREDVEKLLENLERKGQGKAILNGLQPFTQSQSDVAKKPVDLNSAWVIAVIAGVSAAFTVGLLAIGIGWYT